MGPHSQGDLAIHIIEKARTFGTSLAGLADISSVQGSPSHRMSRNARWPAEGKSVLVIALVHPRTEPELDWWDGKGGGSPGDRGLITIAENVVQWLKEECTIKAQVLPYHATRGGIFLKDAAVLAGLGVIGANNLLITPEYGPRIRLRALYIDANLGPTGPIDFSPCNSCDIPCRAVCPQEAFTQGSYSRDVCMRQMNMDEAKSVILEKEAGEGSPRVCVKYCRACELSCPVGQGS